ncbi:DUF2948 family protein [Rhizobium sp. L1K21]|uniref:DUF2948 family protein n=1 Tax=Rhizobium sp. L1K21 TaxID=2954933 RepID=UPI0020926D81|nr:DUF2948 family protein [Rhizobium sp. L1K21]MCO6187493.1 DUF2948 family protein [Rhizobium sp. L1K21]
MTELKLLAMDEEDLDIVSAHMQDAVFKTADVEFDRKRGIFALTANRFVWEKAAEKGKSFERRRTTLVFKRVDGVRSVGFDRKNGDAVLDLLAIQFEKAADGPEGTIELLLAGDGAIRLTVECIEVQLADMGGTWETTAKPQHMVGS